MVRCLLKKLLAQLAALLLLLLGNWLLEGTTLAVPVLLTCFCWSLHTKLLTPFIDVHSVELWGKLETWQLLLPKCREHELWWWYRLSHWWTWAWDKLFGCLDLHVEQCCDSFWSWVLREVASAQMKGYKQLERCHCQPAELDPDRMSVCSHRLLPVWANGRLCSGADEGVLTFSPKSWTLEVSASAKRVMTNTWRVITF